MTALGRKRTLQVLSVLRINGPFLHSLALLKVVKFNVIAVRIDNS